MLRLLLCAVVGMELGRGLVGSAVAHARERVTPSEAEARRLYVEGEAHYAAGRYQDAAVSFEKSYRLNRNPALLLQLGNACERLGNLKLAAEYLRLYVDNPEARNPDVVRQRVARLEAAHAAEQLERDRRRAEEERERSRRRPPPSAPRKPVQPPTRPLPSALPAYVLLGVGAAGMATAIVLGVLSRRAGSDAKAFCSTDGMCQRAGEADLDREKALAIGSDVSLGVGIVAAGVGTYLLIRRAFGSTYREERVPPQRTALRLMVSPTPRGAEVGLVGHF